MSVQYPDGVYRNITDFANPVTDLDLLPVEQVERNAGALLDFSDVSDGDDQWWEDGEDGESPEDCKGFWGGDDDVEEVSN